MNRDEMATTMTTNNKSVFTKKTAGLFQNIKRIQIEEQNKFRLEGAYKQ